MEICPFKRKTRNIWIGVRYEPDVCHCNTSTSHASGPQAVCTESFLCDWCRDNNCVGGLFRLADYFVYVRSCDHVTQFPRVTPTSSAFQKNEGGVTGTCKYVRQWTSKYTEIYWADFSNCKSLCVRFRAFCVGTQELRDGEGVNG